MPSKNSDIPAAIVAETARAVAETWAATQLRGARCL
jgi:hypothetical protein